MAVSALTQLWTLFTTGGAQAAGAAATGAAAATAAESTAAMAAGALSGTEIAMGAASQVPLAAGGAAVEGAVAGVSAAETVAAGLGLGLQGLQIYRGLQGQSLNTPDATVEKEGNTPTLYKKEAARRTARVTRKSLIETSPLGITAPSKGKIAKKSFGGE